MHPYMDISREALVEATRSGSATPTADVYMDYFEIRIPEGGKYYWTRTGADNRYAVFVYECAKPVNTIVLIHGYISHSGTSSFLINHLMGLGYRVVCADLPGHGLSDGERGDIESFASYGEFIRDIALFCDNSWKARPDFIGHSTGCAAMLEYLRQGGTGYSKTIFMGPLVRTWMWDVSLKGINRLEKFTDSFPALRNETSRDRAFLAKTKHDPLRLPRIPVHWVRALEDWNAVLVEQIIPVTQEILILQGTADTAVDAKYGKAYYDRILTSMIYKTMKGSIHCMHSDKEPYRSRVFAEITAYLTDR